MTINEKLEDIQRQLFEKNNVRTDVYYTEGSGASFVPENMPLHPQNIILNIPEPVLMTNNRININFQ